MRALVTGGAGYVGNLLARQLLADGHEVTILDSFMFGYDSVLHLATDPALTLVRADIRDAAGLRNEIAGHDVVYHLAAISGYPACEADPGTAWAVNVEGTRNVLAALDRGQLLIYASSTSIYGPPTLYARTKLAAERDVMQRYNSIAVRWATLFGPSPRMRHELLPNAFVRAAVRRGRLELFSPDQRRTFMHVESAAADYAYMIEAADRLTGHVWDVGDSGLTCSKRQLAEQVARYVPCTYNVRETPDDDGRDIDVDFYPAFWQGLGCVSGWGDHLPALARLYRVGEVAA
jgi:nucleoside-diphosphate-sugar epimerase